MKTMNFKTTLIIIFLGLQSATTTLAQSPASAPITPPVSPPAPPLSSPPVSPPLSSPPVSPPAPPLSPPPPPPAPPLASPPAAVSALPPSSGPANITAILEKAGHFGTLIRFLKRTLVADRITTLLNTTNTGITLFAPTDAAFSNLKPGTLNSLNDQQQVSLLLYHIVPSYLSLAQFQTVSNPVQTQAGSDKTRFPLYITATGSSVNMTTGMVNTTIAGIVYNDGQVAIYQLNNVLLSVGVLRPAVPTRAPAPSPKMAKTSSEAPSVSQDASVADTSDVDGKKMRVGVALALQALAVTLLLAFFP